MTPLSNPHRIRISVMARGSSFLVTDGDGRKQSRNLLDFARKRQIKIKVRKISGVGVEVRRVG